MSGTTQPDIEEVHQVGIRNGVVVGRVRNNGVVLTFEVNRAASGGMGLSKRNRSVLSVLHIPGHPLQLTGISPRRFAQDRRFGKIPTNWQAKSCKSVCYLFIAHIPMSNRATTVGDTIIHERKICNHCLTPVLGHIVYAPCQFPNDSSKRAKTE